MSAKSIPARIRLRGGIEFNVIFHRRSPALVVVEAEGRRPMRVRRLLDGIYAGDWSARVDGTGLTAFHKDPAKAFDVAARHSWRKPV